MSAYQPEHQDRTASLRLEFQKRADTLLASKSAASPYEATFAAEANVPQFPYRVLVVDDEPSIRDAAGAILGSQGYEVLTVADGLEALHALGKSLPDVIISDLNMPRMSGFEFLAIVRKRFPRIATIAMSGEYITGENPMGVLADAFLQKGRYKVEELFEEVAKLLAASPIRSEREKSDIAPLFVPRDRAGYLIITCPNCLRPNRAEAMSLNGGIHQRICPSCSTPVKFEINHEIEPLIKRKHA
jgi:CheY-like chemotaxis protein